MIPRLRALLHRPCRCGHDADAHEHYRPGSDCGWCDCPRFRRAWLRPRPQPVDLDEMRADDQVIEALRVGDVDHACVIADPRLVGRVVAIVAAEVMRGAA